MSLDDNAVASGFDLIPEMTVAKARTVHHGLCLLQVGKSYMSAREGIIMTGNFLLEQLQSLDNAAGGKATFAYGATPFVAALKSEASLHIAATMC